MFKRFKEKWSSLNKDAFEVCDDPRLETTLAYFKNKAVHFLNFALNGGVVIPRDDYRELIEVALIFLGEKPQRGIRFRLPSAFHHARWMAKVIYVLKIYCFRNQFGLTMREEKCCLEFGLFASLVYIEAWIKAPVTTDAPVNDLQLYRSLQLYRNTNQTIADAATKALLRHLCYLGEEMMPLCLFASNDVVSAQDKQ